MVPPLGVVLGGTRKTPEREPGEQASEQCSSVLPLGSCPAWVPALAFSDGLARMYNPNNIHFLPQVILDIVFYHSKESKLR